MGVGDVSDRNHQCLLRDDSLRETVNGGCCPGVSLRSTARLNLDFSYRKSWGMRGGLPSSSPYSYAVMAWCGGGRPSRRPYSCAVGAWIGGVVRFQFSVASRSRSLTTLETLETLTTVSEN